VNGLRDELYWIWLQLVFGVANYRTDEVLKSYPNPKDIFESDICELEKSQCFTLNELKKIKDTKLNEAESRLYKALEYGCKIITPSSCEYPERLKNINAMPLTLYVDGDISDIDNRLAIAMVGTRDLTIYGKKAAEMLARDLVCAGAVIVSGLAKGIDAVCHAAALKAGGKTIAVQGCGLDVVYPAQNRELKRLIAGNGAVVSEYPIGTPSLAHNFPVRNRIISGLSLGVAVVEAGEKSGSLITAGHALTQGRDVFAVPNEIFEKTNYGANKLIKQGAKLVTCADDILEEYTHIFSDKILKNHTPAQFDNNINTKITADGLCGNISAGKKPPAPNYLTKSQLLIYNVLSDKPVGVDEICGASGLMINEVLSAMTELEIYGLATALPGRKYTI